MEVVAVESVTVDGVLQAPGRPDEDERGADLRRRAARPGDAAAEYAAASAATANEAERRFLQRQRDALGVR